MLDLYKLEALTTQICFDRYRCLDLRRQQMNFNIMLRHKVVKLLRRYLEDVHDFVEVPSSELLNLHNEEMSLSALILMLAHGYKVD